MIDCVVVETRRRRNSSKIVSLERACVGASASVGGDKGGGEKRKRWNALVTVVWKKGLRDATHLSFHSFIHSFIHSSFKDDDADEA